MSKSYDNTIPLFAPAAQMRRQIAAIVTDSRAPGEPKSTDGSALFQIYQAFASAEESAQLAKAYADGIAWGDAKQVLFERIDREIAPMRERYNDLIAHPQEVERLLLIGAEKARQMSVPFMRELRHAVGLRPLSQGMVGDATPSNSVSEKSLDLSFKQYREADGRFYFKLVDASGQVWLQSLGFDNPRDAGQGIRRLQQEGSAALQDLQTQLQAADLAAVGQVLDAWRERIQLAAAQHTK
jgi:tryptophanyl-tRNA synthetase